MFHVEPNAVELFAEHDGRMKETKRRTTMSDTP
jgi:hypothetical protein